MLFWTPLLEYIKICPSPISKLSPDALERIGATQHVLLREIRTLELQIRYCTVYLDCITAPRMKLVIYEVSVAVYRIPGFPVNYLYSVPKQTRTILFNV